MDLLKAASTGTLDGTRSFNPNESVTVTYPGKADQTGQMTPLCYALNGKQLPTVALLLQRGASPAQPWVLNKPGMPAQSKPPPFDKAPVRELVGAMIAAPGPRPSVDILFDLIQSFSVAQRRELLASPEMHRELFRDAVAADKLFLTMALMTGSYQWTTRPVELKDFWEGKRAHPPAPEDGGICCYEAVLLAAYHAGLTTRDRINEILPMSKPVAMPASVKTREDHARFRLQMTKQLIWDPIGCRHLDALPDASSQDVRLLCAVSRPHGAKKFDPNDAMPVHLFLCRGEHVLEINGERSMTGIPLRHTTLAQVQNELSQPKFSATGDGAVTLPVYLASMEALLDNLCAKKFEAILG